MSLLLSTVSLLLLLIVFDDIVDDEHDDDDDEDDDEDDEDEDNDEDDEDTMVVLFSITDPISTTFISLIVNSPLDAITKIEKIIMCYHQTKTFSGLHVLFIIYETDVLTRIII